MGHLGRRAFALGAALVLLAACAPQKPPVVSVPSTARTVAVLVSIPPQIRVAAHGITVFESSLETPDVTDWHLEKVALDAATRALSPKFQVVYAEASTAFVDPNSRLDNATENTSPIQTFAREHMTGQSADLIVVICLDVRAFPYPGEGVETFQGIGVSKWLLPIFSYDPLAHSYVYATVLDGKSFAVVAETPLFLPPERAATGVNLGAGGRYPQASLKDFEWSRHWANWTPDQRELVRGKITELLATSTYATLQTTLGIAAP